MRKLILLIFPFLVLSAAPAYCQADRKEVRAGNRKFRKDNFKEAEIDYRKAQVKDSTSIAASYNLASALYRQQDYQGAKAALESVQGENLPSDYHYNKGDAALALKDYKTAVDEFRAALLQSPDDLDAKENYIYAKKMLENQQNQDQNQDQQNQDQDQNQDQNQDQQNQQDQNQDRNQQDSNNNQNQEPSISPQQAQQMLNAIQAREKQTQDKVNREKAALLKSKQKEKNW
ncbi:MAG: tetratricopeptide repeat protein [Bacteroidales bacterium]|nr:tetratricopeptide repeat protein [Bacteroidales bacterium]